MKSRILILSTSLGLGGADQQVIALASNLIQRGHQVKIVSMVPLGVMGLEAQSDGFDIATLNMSRGVPEPRVIPKLIHLINDWQPHILHSHLFHANLLARIVRLFTRVPVIISTAHSIDESNGARWREIAYKFTDFLCDLTICISKAGVERYIQIGLVSREKAKFIPNFVNTNKFKFDSELRSNIRCKLGLGDEFTWLAVGRFDPPKDYPTTIKAFAIVLQQNPNALLIIVGIGKLQSDIEELVKELQIDSNVRFLGARSDVVALMNAADAYLMSSAWEGMPMVLLEAAATQLPVVSTDVGGIKETVLDGKSGFLVPSKNPQLLAQAMFKMMAIPEVERLQMGQKGREFVVANYSTEEVVTQWEQLYCNLLKQRQITAFI
ncbi:glycosyltransferase [Anabaena sp. UHCC 0187]|uniref:glycosyltransferase n=1 Tax=Anabaena sp. UHCC 0187 TaxID=2590018 RepID=UPI001446A07D|nr:glycosyltransferase [Anabaena sp. UHCC 0187]MTJ12920.1 glycosyltransferase [Anabaena sp. UHCC 0187]